MTSTLSETGLTKTRLLESWVESTAPELQPVRSPFGFRVDGDNDKFSTFVPTQTRNAAGDVVQKAALLDLHVDIASGERTIAEHGQMLADVLSAKSGIRVYCCQSFGVGVPWGQAKTTFAAQDLPAR